MATLTEDMKRLITEQRLGFYATVCDDGSPNLSPKGTTYVWDDERLFFADVLEVMEARAVVSPVYDGGAVAEADMVRMFQARFARLHPPA